MNDPRHDSVGISTRALVEGMVREDGTVDGGELYAVAAALGMTDQQVRLCINRLITEGQFTREGRGRRVLLRATADTRRSIEPNIEFVRFMYEQDRGRAPWDRTWRLVAFAVPEAARPARDALRDAIVRLGGAPLHGGLYVCANDWEGLVEAEADRLGVLDCVTFMTSGDLRIGGEREPRALAARLWPLEEIAKAHARLADVARSRLDRLRASDALSPTELLTITIELAAEFTRAVETDPLLPPELLPRPWSGTRARALLAQCWSRLLEQEGQPRPPRLFRLYADVVREVAGAFGDEDTAVPAPAAYGRTP
ncbi:PaaX family transcriptional regulator C-terminal domain-containing protein [Streptosporangium sp. CA-135522]|uniref:PaaX family transcriptional regulator C-terminal domain-containing protein n=1 Tax=Streptosporangium sp. CA-135522 TaxID=3240072 RepID=UPI003D8D87B7